jgi:MYXO-CTERM domain-containing protein
VASAVWKKNKHLVTLSLLGIVGTVLTAAAPAAAQSLRPNILVIFDSSGSMLANNSTLDGSPLCNNQGQGSRIFSLKKALRDAMAQVGTDEANFGLMRYPELDRPMQTPVCPQGHYANNSTTALPLNCNGNCSGNCKCGCRLHTHTTQTTYADVDNGAWFDSGLRDSLLVDVTKRPAGTKPMPGDFDPSDANISEVYRWIDQTESAGTGATIADPELRTHDQWYTPIGRSLFYARLYFDNYVKVNDPKASCRTNLVIFVTDGEETCDTTGGSALDLATCAQTGYTAFHPEVQACQLFRTTNVKTYVLTDTSTGAANDAIAKAGGTNAAIRVTLTDTNAVKAALLGIIAETVPPAEMCNGKDDNCNGLIDEGVKNMCPLDLTNLTHCAVETCNCKDDNCNGVVDEGFAPNACGKPCGCAVPTELCNGLDDNCNGDIDEGFNVGQTCTNNGVGNCRRGGLLACKPDGSGTFCDAPVVPPGIETCNGMDDNCDGQIDEGTLPGVGEPCGVSLGTCMAGKTVCQNGHLVCTTSTMPGNEVCNGIDDNCDGVIDNGIFPEVGKDCLCPGLDPAKVGVGQCKGGHLICAGKAGFVCVGCVLPMAEICDGLDNDCDGKADTTAMCQGGFLCRDGQCAPACQSGEFTCPAGYKCVGDVCVPQRCAKVKCTGNTRCDENTGQCVDPCAGVVCADPKVCQNGSCVDCNTLGCGTGQLCVAGRCQVNKCLGVTCGDGQFCNDGQCQGLCQPGQCNSTQRCVAGQCQTDPCANVGCSSAGQFCDPATGTCKTDKCQATQCTAGFTCLPTTGECKPDPCKVAMCPADCWKCDVSADGLASCTESGACKVIPVQVGTRGGAGCACAVGESSEQSGALVLMLAGMAGMFATRRRRSPARR